MLGWLWTINEPDVVYQPRSPQSWDSSIPLPDDDDSDKVGPIFMCHQRSMDMRFHSEGVTDP